MEGVFKIPLFPCRRMDNLHGPALWSKMQEPYNMMDGALRIIATAAFFIWNFYEGSVFESPYTLGQVKLYSFPLWRLALLILVFLAALWCPKVGAMVAVAVFFYFEDLQKLTQTW
jgi:hypothetical protein